MLPYKFEAGTPDIAGAIGLHAALDYIDAIGSRRDRRARARPAGLRHAGARSDRRRPADRHGARTRRASCRSSWTACIRTTSARSSIAKGVAIRTGHHCAQPVMERFGIPATARASLAMYNTREELDALGRALRQGARGVRLMSELSDLYQEVILDHNRRPRNFHALAGASHTAEGYNPLCGDRLTLYLKLTDGDDQRRRVRGRRAAPSRRRRRR